MKESKLEICPCCGYHTLKIKSNYEICPLCNWEDEFLNPESLLETLNSFTCNNISLFEAQENFIKQAKKLNNYNILRKFTKKSEFLTEKEKVFNLISSNNKFLPSYFAEIKTDKSEEESYQKNLFRIVIEYLEDKEIPDYIENIIEILNLNIFPTLKLNIITCLVSFKTKVVKDFLSLYITENENVDSKENVIINSF